MVELGSFHPPLLDLEPGGVGQDGRLQRQLGPVGERSDHDRALAVGVGETALRVWGAVVVEEALDVPGEHRAVADGVDEPEQVHRHARLVAIGVGDDNAGPVGLHLEDRTHGGVELGVDQQHVLAPVDRLDDDPRRRLDLTGALDDRLDAGRSGDEHRVAGDRPSHRRRSVRSIVVLVGSEHRRVDPRRRRKAWSAFSTVRLAMATRSMPVIALHRPSHTSAHVAGAHHPHLDGASLLLAPLQRSIDDLHHASLGAGSHNGQLRS